MKKYLSLILAGALCLPLAAAPVQYFPAAIQADAVLDTPYIEYEGMAFACDDSVNECRLYTYDGEGGDIVVPEKIGKYTVTGISGYVFAKNKDIKSVTLPDTVYDMSTGVFSESSLTSVNIPKSTTVIPKDFLRECENLNNVEFHDNIVAISPSAFFGTNIDLPENLLDKVKNTDFDSAYGYYSTISHEEFGDWTIDFEYDLTTGIKKYAHVYSYNGEEKNLVFPESVDDIPAISFYFSLFYKYVYIEETDSWEKVDLQYDSLTIPGSMAEGLYEIDRKYIKAKNITLKVPESMNDEYIVPSFSTRRDFGYDVQSASSPILPNNYIETITIEGNPKTVKFETCAFVDSENLKQIVIPESCENLIIGSSAFRNCVSLEDIKLPKNLKSLSIEKNAFENCTSLEAFELPETCQNVEIGENAFIKTGLKKVSIPVKNKIGTYAFSECSSLESVYLKNTSSSSGAFSECGALKDVTLINSDKIDMKAFYNCPELENVTISGVENISDSAFIKCRNLSSINGIKAYDSSSLDFNEEIKDIVYTCFRNSDDIGFLNDYTAAWVKKVIAENITDDMSEMQKLKTLHDWVCEHTLYDSEGASDYFAGTNDAGIFMNGLAVCEGYAKTLNLLLNEAGIESCVVVNKVHAWNIVKIGNMYFHVDSTWDDFSDGTGFYYKWFMKSDDEFKTETTAHSSWSINNADRMSALHLFQKNELPVCSSIMGDTDNNGKIEINDAVKIMSYVTNSDKYPLMEDSLILSDVYNIGDGVNNMDALQLQKNLAGIN